jgi:O-antigen/teichoic acid export membrane protein
MGSKMSASRSKRTAQNMVFGFIYHIVTVVLSFVSRTVFINTLGIEYQGLNTIFSDVLSLLSMADLGFGLAMSYSFYKPLAEDDKDRIKSLIAFFRKIYNIIAVSVTIVGLLFTPFLRYIVKTQQDVPHLEIYYFFGLADIVLSYLFVYKTTLLVADQKDYMVSKVRTVASIVGTLLKILVLIIWHNYILYLIVNLAVSFFTNFYQSQRAVKEYSYIRNLRDAKELDKESRKSIFSTLKSVMLYKVSMLLFHYTDNILISMILGTALVGIYSNYWMLSTRLVLVEQIVFGSMVASVGNLMVKENEEKRLEVFESMQSISNIFCGIITCVYALVADDMVHVWLGKEFQVSQTVVIAIALNTYFTSVLHPVAIIREAAGIYNKVKYCMLFGSALNIFLSIVLGMKIGLAGIILASVLSRMASYFWYEPVIIFRDYFGKSSGRFFLGLGKNIVLVLAVIMIMHTFSKNFVPENWLELFLKGGIIGVICTLIFMSIYIRTPGAQNIILKVKGLMKRN